MTQSDTNTTDHKSEPKDAEQGNTAQQDTVQGNTSFLFYNALEPLDVENHHHLALTKDTGYAFAQNIHCIPCVLEEVPILAHEYPIVFGRDGDNVILLVCLGVQENQNAFVKGDFWHADYVPAYVRQYPFWTAQTDEDTDQKVLCIDPSATHFTGDSSNAENPKARLFNDDHSHTDTLQDAIGLAEELLEFDKVTQDFCNTIASLDILIQTTYNGEHGSVDMYTINARAFDDLPNTILQELAHSKILGTLLDIASSQKNWINVEKLHSVQ